MESKFSVRFHITVPVALCYSGEFICIAVTIVVTAKYSRNLIP